MALITHRDGIQPEKDGGFLRFLYRNFLGRALLRILIARPISILCGKFLDSSLSRFLIKPFVKNNNIDLSEYESDNFKCFNDCFVRKIKDGLRPLDAPDTSLISPCDGLLSAYHITGDEIIPVKQSAYSVCDLVEDRDLAEHFRDGTCLVFRLCTNHYHRYGYPVSGVKSENIFIHGKLHTVRPIALSSLPVFSRNCREYTVMESEYLGKIVQMEVGAMLVGKIKNHHGTGKIIRGDEKGMFLYGGSTVILLLEKGVEIPDFLFENTEKGLETPIKMNEEIGKGLC